MNLNADLGEGILHEKEIFPWINSCSIACGGHYGNANSILNSLELAIKYQVLPGAHPSYPDKKNFGRISIEITKNEFQSSIRDQINLYFEVLTKLNLKNDHIKAHGALYNDLAKNSTLAEWYLECIQEFPFNFLYLPPNSEIEKLAIRNNIPYLKEGFLDRNYNLDGSLVPRSQKNALIQNKKDLLIQFDKFEKENKFNTYCLHGDHPKILEFLKILNLKNK